MATLKIPKRKNSITALFFQICVITNNVFGTDPQLYIISKIMTLAFFAVVALRILYKGKVRLNQILLLPTLFTVYCGATILWAYLPSQALNQMVTQIQLFLLLIFTYWAMEDGTTVLDYLKAVYISGFGMAIFALLHYGGITQYTDAMLSGERMGGEITNMNTYGMVFGNAALATAYYFILQKKRIHIVSFVIFSFFAFSSASRKSMLMIVAGVVALSVIHFGFRKIYKTLLMVLVVLVTAILVLRLPYFSQISNRIEKLFSGEVTASDRERRAMIAYGLQEFKKRPIHGFGIGNYAFTYIRGGYSHNNYIELLYSGGVIALVLYYLMFLLPVLGLLLGKGKGEKLRPLHQMLLLWLAVELVFGAAMVQVYTKNSWLLAGVLMAEAARIGRKETTLREDDDETVRKIEESSV